MLHLVYGTNSPLIFASLFRYSLLHFHLSHMAVHHLLLHHLHYHHLHLLLLVQSFFLNLKTWLFSKSFPPSTFSFLTGLILWTLGARFTKFDEIMQCNGNYAVKGHSMSPILAPIETSYTTSY